LIRKKECLHEYLSISKAEEAFFKQKSRNQWLQLGDQNTSFFHKVVKVKKYKSLITHSWDDDGNRAEGVDQIKKVAVEFYKGLLGSTSHVF
jgi:hypothetical protein